MGTKATKPVLLVGGIPGDTAEEVFRICAPEVGDLTIGLPDGEIGPRRLWVLYISHWILETHPDLEVVRKPKGIPGMPEWIPAGYDDLMKVKVKNGRQSIRFDKLGYADFAKDSYAKFTALRKENLIPKDTRFQVCIPFPEDAIRLFTASPRDFEIIAEAYQEALEREVKQIAKNIPPADLALQWDINWEVIAIETDDGGKAEPLTYKLNGDPFGRYRGYVKRLSSGVPEEALLGLHLCYGDYQHKHYLQPKDLGISVKMANAGVAAVGRRVDFVHMPVPRDRNDGAYFAPLKDLDIGKATLYIGLVHYTDGVDGTMKRLDTFNRHYAGTYGIATECGLGRRPADQRLVKLLRIHREVAERL